MNRSYTSKNLESRFENQKQKEPAHVELTQLMAPQRSIFFQNFGAAFFLEKKLLHFQEVSRPRYRFFEQFFPENYNFRR